MTETTEHPAQRLLDSMKRGDTPADAPMFGPPLMRPALAMDMDGLIARAERLGWNSAIIAAREAMPSTPADPNESAYDRGRFDGIMAYAAVLRGLHKPLSSG